MPKQIISVIGCLGFDMIMVTDEVPAPGESLRAHSYEENLGGKGANSAIASFRCSHRRPERLEDGPIDSTNGTLSIKPGYTPPAHPLRSTPGWRPQSEIGGGGVEDDDDEIEVRMVGAVGEDLAADMHEAQLLASGVDVTGLVRIPGTRTNVCFIMVEKQSGENRCLFVLGAVARWTEADFARVDQLAPGAPRTPDLLMLQMEAPVDVVEAMIRTAGEAKIEVLLNAAPAGRLDSAVFPYLTHLLVNEGEGALLSGLELDEYDEAAWPVVAQKFLSLGVKNVVLTLGEKGALYANETGMKRVPAYKVNVVDTTGAGDTFNGTYATEYLRQKAAGVWDIEAAVTRANKACAMTILKLGTTAGVPWYDEIDAFDAPVRLLPGEEGYTESVNDLDDDRGEGSLDRLGEMTLEPKGNAANQVVEEPAAA